MLRHLPLFLHQHIEALPLQFKEPNWHVNSGETKAADFSLTGLDEVEIVLIKLKPLTNASSPAQT